MKSFQEMISYGFEPSEGNPFLSNTGQEISIYGSQYTKAECGPEGEDSRHPKDRGYCTVS